MKHLSSYIKYIVVLLLFGIFARGNQTHAVAPTFDDNFAKYMISNTPDKNGRVESVFSFSDCIRRDQSIEQNIRNLFYPSTINDPNNKCSFVGTGGLLWEMVKVLTFGLIFLFIVVNGITLLMSGAEGSKKTFTNMMYLGYGAFLVYGSIWILGYVLNIENMLGSADLVNNLENNLFLQILSFFKVLAFFLAIIMMVWTGFKIMSALDQEEKIKAGRKGLVNIIVSLVFIKIVDYIFYIAQTSEFASKASDLVLDLARILGWILGFTFVLGLFFTAYTMFASNGKEESFKKTKSILVNIFMISLVVFFFLLIIYQIFGEFVK